jgi:hypothetical protein
MARFGLVGPAYRSQSVLADCQVCMEWYLEPIESGMGKSVAALYPTPGLSAALYALGPAGMRGETTIQGRTFAIAGTNLVELLAPTAEPNFILRGQVISDGQSVSLAGGGYQLLIASAGKAYVFDLTKNTLTPVDPSGGGNIYIVEVCYIDGFFFALVANPTTPWQINSSNLNDATTWQAVNFTIVSVFADNPNAIFENQRLLWVFGPKKIQPYQNTGDFPFPFDVIPGTLIETGLAAPRSVAKLDNSIFWLGGDERGQGIVWRANGFSPQRVSTFAIEYEIQHYATMADAVAYSYQDQGHSFYVLSFPTANTTWVYDVASGQWHERGFWDTKSSTYKRSRAAFHTFNFGMHLVGDPTTGAVYQQSVDILTHFGNPIRRLRRAPHISKEQRRMLHSRLQVDAEVGIGPNLQGNEPATLFWLTDANGNNWQFGVNDVGAFALVKSNAGAPAALYLNDTASETSWEIVPSVLGQPNPVPVTYNPSYPAAILMVSTSGETQWVMTVKQLVLGIGQLVAQPLGIVGRGPLWVLRWSDDGGQTWSHEHARDGGQIGGYKQRLIWNRLGMPRDRVYQLSISDPVPARVIEAYLDADGYQPSERLAKQIAKQT